MEESEAREQYFATKVDLVPVEEMEFVAAVEEVVCEEPASFEQESVQSEIIAKTTIDMETQTPKCPMYSICNFEKDDQAVHFYSGLKFFFVLNTLGPAAYCLNYAYNSVTNMSVPDQFFLVLIKLRRLTTNFELSRMFGIAESVICNIFVTWIIFMYRQWGELDIWPSQKLDRYFAPTSFRRHYPNTRVIIDGTECSIRKPKNPTAQQATFSTYKNRNTVKVLVGCTPGGLVSYVSPSYGGSTSDRQIVERSSLVRICDRNDSVMADKGFNVQDIFAPKDVHINIPTFFKKKNRMSGESVIRDRKISSKRVHTERVIGLAKTYKILAEPLTATETRKCFCKKAHVSPNAKSYRQEVNRCQERKSKRH
ncbi:uncharacterized protein LOC123549725 [Mercenaria mercenaria]|uniref:uncharacterized protein LOC123549725 n=1 Tax=Mercenaria mercenaria TaxID=6596 RepID=UPI00234F3FE6|nr:uncharacterized protein LOC123549725 [Mercenaria mercenaria]